jgi:hypothetical protein
MSSQRGSDNVLAPGTAESGTLVSRADTQRTVGGTEAKGILLWLILFVFLTLKNHCVSVLQSTFGTLK